MKNIYLLTAILLAFTFQLSAQRVSPYTKLVWSDEFDGTGLPDPAKWGYEVGYVRNGELQYFTKSRVENAYQEGGYLHIKAMKDDPVYDNDGNLLNTKTDRITSASIITKGKAAWTYGRIEARVKVPGPNRGSWPAVWMMPQDNRWGNWPNSGEIDIMEHVGYAPEQSHFTAHTATYHDKGTGGLRSKALDTPRVYDDFHVFAIEWDTEGIYWYFDDHLPYHQRAAHEFYNESNGSSDDWKVWPFQRDFYLILGLSYGGGWGGRNGVDYQLPMEYLVDYVRVYKESVAITTVREEEINIYPNPVVNTLHFDGVDCLPEVMVKNINGQTVAQFQNVEKSVDLSHLNKGYYILQMKDKAGNSYRQKILKK
ncbi:hypothetical protein FACS189413_05290 [Bacteroidia bacterium]|nr:hypothetical protein FACS189413_05290 [Bacteroidia bacterium]